MAEQRCHRVDSTYPLWVCAPAWTSANRYLHLCTCVCACVSSQPLTSSRGALLLPPSPQLECAKVRLHSLKVHMALISCGQGWSTLGELWSNLVHKETGWRAIWPPCTQPLCRGLTDAPFLARRFDAGLHKQLDELSFSTYLQQLPLHVKRSFYALRILSIKNTETESNNEIKWSFIVSNYSIGFFSPAFLPPNQNDV